MTKKKKKAKAHKVKPVPRSNAEKTRDLQRAFDREQLLEARAEARRVARVAALGAMQTCPLDMFRALGVSIEAAIEGDEVPLR
jgi:hypothetical protein